MIAARFVGARNAVGSSAAGGVRADLRRARHAFVRPIDGSSRDLRFHDRRIKFAQHLFPRLTIANLKPMSRVRINDAPPGAAR